MSLFSYSTEHSLDFKEHPDMYKNNWIVFDNCLLLVVKKCLHYTYFKDKELETADKFIQKQFPRDCGRGQFIMGWGVMASED